jgi:prephenate dehydratase
MSPPPERDDLPRAAFLGPAGTFSEEALRAGAEAGAVEAIPKPTIFETVTALRDGTVELAVVPIENSLEGSINVTLDLLADNAPAVRIVAETRVRIRHSLIAASSVPLTDIGTVISHPQVPGQCTRFLRGELAHAEVRLADSTAEAVRAVVAAADPSTAALGTTLAAEIYGGTVLREGVQDREDNETRFVWLAGGDRPGGALPLRAGDGERRCSIVFWGAGAEHPGWLVRCLGEFADREINLTKIESRPRRERMGSYMFFADLGGGEEDPAVAAALASLGGMCEEVRVLGSYASARGG